MNGTWWYFDGIKDCTYIWSEFLDREKAYKLERVWSTHEYGMEYEYGVYDYKMSSKVYFSDAYFTKCYDNGYPASTEDTFYTSGIVFKLTENEENCTLNSDAFGKIVLEYKSGRDFIILLQILSLSGIFCE